MEPAPLIPRTAVSRAPGVVYAADPEDRLHPTYVKWFALGWTIIGVTEVVALVVEKRMREGKVTDRRKRTLTAIIRFLFATDSVTGIPVDVPYGRTRRFGLNTLLGPGWFPGHFGQEERM